MKKAAIFLLITLLASQAIIAQKTSISGIASKAQNKKIKLVKYGDMISFLEVDFQESEIDKNGNFRMEFDLKEIIFTQVRIEYQSSEFYIEPKSSYELLVRYDDSTSQISFTNPVELQFDIASSTGKLNQDIHEFNKLYNDFIVNNFEFLYKFRDKKLLEHFKSQVNKEFPDIRNPYLRDYITYTIASIEKFSKVKSFKKVAEDYFIGKPVRYQNIAYMDFFNQFFEKYFLAASRDVDWDEFIFYINSKPDYYRLVKTASQDAMLQNDMRILEMVVLITLKELYYLQGMNEKGIHTILKTASEKMRYEENRQIAGNLLKKLRMLEPGTQASDFKLPAIGGEEYSLEDFRDSLVYINFWNQSCKLCLQELDSIAAVKKLYNPEIQFISILTAQDSIGVSEFIKNKNFDWLFLYYDNNYDLLEDYSVRTLPTNFLIGRYKRILKNPAWLPGESLDHIIRKLSKRKN